MKTLIFGLILSSWAFFAHIEWNEMEFLFHTLNIVIAAQFAFSLILAAILQKFSLMSRLSAKNPDALSSEGRGTRWMVFCDQCMNFQKTGHLSQAVKYFDFLSYAFFVLMLACYSINFIVFDVIAFKTLVCLVTFVELTFLVYFNRFLNAYGLFRPIMEEEDDIDKDMESANDLVFEQMSDEELAAMADGDRAHYQFQKFYSENICDTFRLDERSKYIIREFGGEMNDWAAISKFLQKHKSMLEKEINTMKTMKTLFHQPVILFLYYMCANKPERLKHDFPYPAHKELESIFSIMGKSFEAT